MKRQKKVNPGKAMSDGRIFMPYATRNVEIEIPLGIFSRKLGILETIVKYLRENRGYTFKEIGILMDRDNKMLWSCYSACSKKYKRKFAANNFYDFVPLDFFIKTDLSCFESVVLVMKDVYGYSFRRIADIFKRNYQTVWTTYRRGVGKK